MFGIGRQSSVGHEQQGLSAREGAPTTMTLGHWDPMPPRQLADLLNGLRVSWWIAGGWALDLFIGRETRGHDDTDVEILRHDQLEIQCYLEGWDLHSAARGVLRPWESGEWLGEGINSVWCRRSPDEGWALQIMLADAQGDAWVYRRSPDITRPLREVGLLTVDGIPYLDPEIQLLYKSASPRRKDEADFELVLPCLCPDRRRWLADALLRAHPGHPWLAQL